MLPMISTWTLLILRAWLKDQGHFLQSKIVLCAWSVICQMLILYTLFGRKYKLFWAYVICYIYSTLNKDSVFCIAKCKVCGMLWYEFHTVAAWSHLVKSETELKDNCLFRCTVTWFHCVIRKIWGTHWEFGSRKRTKVLLFFVLWKSRFLSDALQIIQWNPVNRILLVQRKIITLTGLFQ